MLIILLLLVIILAAGGISAPRWGVPYSASTSGPVGLLVVLLVIWLLLGGL